MKILTVVAVVCTSALVLFVFHWGSNGPGADSTKVAGDASRAGASSSEATLRLEIERELLALERERLELERAEWENTRQSTPAETASAIEDSSPAPLANPGEPAQAPLSAPQLTSARQETPALAGGLKGSLTASPVRQADYSLFYDELRPYGAWFETVEYGFVWQPAAVRPQSDWRPYTLGCWVYTDLGWTWCSDEPFGWAVYHYGRWTLLHTVGWVWVPGPHWAPAWVSWRVCPSYIGWAPLPAVTVFEVYIHFGTRTDSYCGISPHHYNFVPSKRFGEPAHRHCMPLHQNGSLFSKTVNVTHIRAHRDTIFAEGPNPDSLRDRFGNPLPRRTLHRIAWTPGCSEAAPHQRDASNLQFPAPRIECASPGAARPRWVAGRIDQVRPLHLEARPDTELVRRFARERARQELVAPRRPDTPQHAEPGNLAATESTAPVQEEGPSPRNPEVIREAIAQREARLNEMRWQNREPRPGHPAQTAHANGNEVIPAAPIPSNLGGNLVPAAAPLTAARGQARELPASSLPQDLERPSAPAIDPSQPAPLHESPPHPVPSAETTGRMGHSSPLNRFVSLSGARAAPGQQQPPLPGPRRNQETPLPRDSARDRTGDDAPPRRESSGPARQAETMPQRIADTQTQGSAPQHPAADASPSGESPPLTPSTVSVVPDAAPVHRETSSLPPVADHLVENPTAAIPDRTGERADEGAQTASHQEISGEAGMTEAIRKAQEEAQQAEAARRAQEEAQRAEAVRKAQEEAQRQAEAIRKAQEEAQQVEAARRAQEEAQRAEAVRKAQEEAQQAEAMRKAQEEAQQAEAMRKAQEEAQRQAEAIRKAQEAEAMRKAQEEAQRQAEAARRAQEEAQRAEAVRKAQEEAQQAEAARRAQEEAQRQAEAAQKKQD